MGASHNGSACLLRGSEIVVAVQEERLSGVKRAAVSLATDCLSARYCLEAADLRPEDLDVIAVSALPSLATPANRLADNPYLGPATRHVPVVAVGHHLAHAASAYALSGFSEAAILVIDGAGSPHTDLDASERRAIAGPLGSEAISMYAAEGRAIAPIAKQMVADGWVGARNGGMRTFGTLGGMYSAVAEQIFGDLLAAGKVMGLAPYGRATIPTSEFLAPADGAIAFTSKVAERFRHGARWPAHGQEYADLSASVQSALELALAAVLEDLRRRIPGVDRLCYAGGVALNAVANEKVVHRGPYDEVFIVPPAEDSGLAIGAAYLALWSHADGRPSQRRPRREWLGRPYGEEDVEGAFEATPGIAARRSTDVLAETCDRLAAGEVVGWFQGGSELGPRALGHRSLLCDPRDASAKARLNAKVKFREPFRPFAPVVTERSAPDWFDVPDGLTSPFMLRAVPFRVDRARQVPAVVHEDRTGRVQTVEPGDDPLLHSLLEAWKAVTGVPMLINTSFNLAAEPIVETPEDALRCLLASRIDCCVVGSWIVTRAAATSLLDLRPLRAAVPVPGGDAAVVGERGRRSLGEATPHRVETRWGPTVVPLSPQEAALVAAATGEATGRELVRRHLHDTTEEAGLTSLHRLGRMRVLRFVEP